VDVRAHLAKKRLNAVEPIQMAANQKLLFLIGLLAVIPFKLWADQKQLLFDVDGRSHPLTPKPEFSSDYHDIVFLFPNRSGHVYHYKFYLKGLESRWQHAIFPMTRYTNLNGGDYLFIVQVWDGSKKISEHTASFVIKEDFWEKWWFLLFAIIAIVSFITVVIYFWFLYDFRQRMKVQEIRQRIAADLHDEVGANLSSITFLIELLRKRLSMPQDDLKTLIEKISRNSQESAMLINDTIWALNPEYDSLEKLSAKMKSFAAEILASRDIALTFTPDKAVITSLSIDQRKDIYLIFKEAVNNAAKHSGANQVAIEMIEKDGSLEVSIADNGIGFDSVKTYAGNGLKNYERRSRNGGLSVKVQSTPGSGTVIRITTNSQNH
jgi:two-component sensor histidine kinase